MNLRKIIDNFGINLENLERNISQKNKAVKLEYKRTALKNVDVLVVNKYGEVIGTTHSRVLPPNYFK